MGHTHSLIFAQVLLGLYRDARAPCKDLLNVAQLLGRGTVGAVPVAAGHRAQRRVEASQVIDSWAELTAQQLPPLSVHPTHGTVIVVLRYHKLA